MEQFSNKEDILFVRVRDSPIKNVHVASVKQKYMW